MAALPIEPLEPPVTAPRPMAALPIEPPEPPVAAPRLTAAPPIELTAPAVASPTPPPFPPRAPAPLPTQDLSGLEEQLRTITTQIETLRTPGVEEAINALRDELGTIAHTLTEAMPRRAIEAIERQIAGLDQRIADSRQAGIDASALSGIEHGLAEVRDALHGLTPAENLVGFNDAAASLAHKIDMIVAQRDPATMQQFEHAVTTLRDISAHVASNETVGQLAAEVQRLAQNVEQIAMASGGGDVLANLEHRIGALSDALSERTQNGASVPPRLEALVNSLSDKIEQVQNSRSDNVAFGHLEDRIATLVQKLDASDSRLAHLETIERGLADLLVHIADIKASKEGGASHGDAAPAVDSLKHEIARTQNELDAVHGTLGHVVDRLAIIEQGIGEPHQRPQAAVATAPLDLKQPVGKLAVRLIDAAAAPPVAPDMELPPPLAALLAPSATPAMAEPPAQPKRMPAARQMPIDPDLPHDQPLEPGSGRPPMRANAAARIAASEAALGGARPAAASVPSNKSNFIAAARRAAQAAVQESAPARPSRQPRSAADFMDADAGDAAPARKGLMKRMKSLFIAASIVAVAIGAVQLAANFVDFGGRNAKVAQTKDAAADKTADAAPADETDAPATVAANSEPAQADAADAGNAPAAAPAAPEQPRSSAAAPSLWSAPAAGQLPDFVTGSISQPAPSNPTMPQTPLILPPAHNGNHLPVAIGGIRLRSAAAAGDAAAAYEVGMRFAEGRGLPADMTEAARWFERAASKGLVPAQYRYGSLLEKGQGVKKDLAQARRLYLAAAGAGNAKAMHNLAVLYAEGVDGKPDYDAAVQWFQNAAEHGIPDSQFNLGVLYARGIGVNVSFADSYKWFALAASKGDKEAVKKRDEVASRLDPQTLATAQLAVRNFIPRPQPDTAINVAQPPGGWDAIASAPPPARAKQHIAGPLVLGNR